MRLCNISPYKYLDGSNLETHYIKCETSVLVLVVVVLFLLGTCELEFGAYLRTEDDIGRDFNSE